MEHTNIIQICLSIAIAVIMLGMGLSLTLADFVRIKQDPKGVFIGVFNQLVLLPIFGYLIILAFGLKAELAVGIMLIAACPGGATSNLIANLAKGDLGLSVTLTAISSLVTVFSIPFILNWSLAHFMGSEGDISLDFWDSFFKMIGVTILPISIGMFIRTRSVSFADRMEKPVKIASVVFMTLIIIGAVLANKNVLATAMPEVGPAVIALNLLTMVVGFYFGKFFNLALRQQICISIECGIQNATLALFVGTLGMMANYHEILLAPAIYGVLMFGTSALSAVYFARLVKREEAYKIQH